MIQDNVDNDMRPGTIGEEQVLTYLKSQGEVICVRADSDFRKKDIDLILYKDGKKILISLKMDPVTEGLAHRTKKFFFEISSDSKSPGCFMFSEADIWMILVPGEGTLYSFPLKELRSHVILNQNAYKNIAIPKDGYSVEGVVASIEEICANVKHDKVNLLFD